MIPSHSDNVENSRFKQRFFWLGVLTIILMTFIVYYPSMYGEFVWDDDDHFSDSPVMAAPDGLRRIWMTNETIQYYPVTFSTFWIERRLWDIDPTGYHLVNTAFHVANALLLWLLLAGLGIRGAWIAGAVFAVHPVHVESVAWITERKNVLSGLFYLLTIMSYLQFVLQKKWKWYVLAFVLFLLALLSKTTTVVLPMVLLICIWWQNKKVNLQDIIKTLPFFALSAFMSVVTVWYEHTFTMRGVEEWDVGLPERIAIAGRVVWFYLIKLLMPLKLTFIYPRWSFDPVTFSVFLPLIILLVLGVIVWRQRFGWGRPVIAGLGYFVICLAPVMGIIRMYYYHYSFVADHFQYLASMGAIALIVGTVSWRFEQWDVVRANRISGRALGLGFGLVVLVFFGTLTWRQNYIYRDIEALWQDTIKKNPAAWMAYNNLGVTYAKKGLMDKAIAEYRKTLSVKPDSYKAYSNLGLIYLKEGLLDDAIREFKNALKISPYKPLAHNGLGLVYKKKGLAGDAIKEFKEALKFKSSYMEARSNLALTYMDQGLLDEALNEYKTVISLNPDISEARNNLGNIYLIQKKFTLAIGEYEEALKLNPDNAEAYYNLAIAYENVGSIQAAILNYRKFINIAPLEYRETVESAKNKLLNLSS